jgi:hypothetical protein
MTDRRFSLILLGLIALGGIGGYAIALGACPLR